MYARSADQVDRKPAHPLVAFYRARAGKDGIAGSLRYVVVDGCAALGDVESEVLRHARG